MAENKAVMEALMEAADIRRITEEFCLTPEDVQALGLTPDIIARQQRAYHAHSKASLNDHRANKTDPQDSLNEYRINKTDAQGLLAEADRVVQLDNGFVGNIKATMARITKETALELYLKKPFGVRQQIFEALNFDLAKASDVQKKENDIKIRIFLQQVRIALVEKINETFAGNADLFLPLIDEYTPSAEHVPLPKPERNAAELRALEKQAGNKNAKVIKSVEQLKKMLGDLSHPYYCSIDLVMPQDPVRISKHPAGDKVEGSYHIHVRETISQVKKCPVTALELDFNKHPLVSARKELVFYAVLAMKCINKMPEELFKEVSRAEAFKAEINDIQEVVQNIDNVEALNSVQGLLDKLNANQAISVDEMHPWYIEHLEPLWSFVCLKNSEQNPDVPVPQERKQGAELQALPKETKKGSELQELEKQMGNKPEVKRSIEQQVLGVRFQRSMDQAQRDVQREHELMLFAYNNPHDPDVEQIMRQNREEARLRAERAKREAFLRGYEWSEPAQEPVEMRAAEAARDAQALAAVLFREARNAEVEAEAKAEAEEAARRAEERRLDAFEEVRRYEEALRYEYEELRRVEGLEAKARAEEAVRKAAEEEARRAEEARRPEDIKRAAEAKAAEEAAQARRAAEEAAQARRAAEEAAQARRAAEEAAQARRAAEQAAAAAAAAAAAQAAAAAAAQRGNAIRSRRV